MIKILFYFLLGLLPYQAFSQLNEDEAKAAFLLAEEYYSKSEFRNALGFIEKAKKSLGKGNCKIYYLEILMRYEMYRSDISQYTPLMASINAFQSSNDIGTFNKEKIIEVLKIKMLLQQDYEIKSAADSINRMQEARRDRNFNEYNFKGSPLNVSYNELKSSKFNHPFFLDNPDTKTIKLTGRTYYFNEKQVKWFGQDENSYFFIKDEIKDSVATIAVGSDGLIKRYTRLKSYNKLTKEQAKTYITNLVERYTKSLGFDPQIKNFKLIKHSTCDFETTDYLWSRNNKFLVLRSIIDEYYKSPEFHVHEIIGVE